MAVDLLWKPSPVGLLIDRYQCLAASDLDAECSRSRFLRGMLPDVAPALTLKERVVLANVAGRSLARTIRLATTGSQPAVMAAFVRWQACSVTSETWYEELQALTERCAQAIESGAKRPESSQPSCEDRRLGRVLQLIDRRFADPSFSIKAVAAAIDLSVWHTARLLSEKTGRTFTWHVHHARIEAAAGLLQTTPLLIKEIAVRVGYSGSTRFGKQFRHLRATTPSLFRASSADRAPTAKSDDN